MSLFYSVENIEKRTFQGMKKSLVVLVGLHNKALKHSTVKAFEKLANILLTDFIHLRAKTRQNPPKYRTKTDSPNNEINVTIEIKKPKKFGHDVIIIGEMTND